MNQEYGKKKIQRPSNSSDNLSGLFGAEEQDIPEIESVLSAIDTAIESVEVAKKERESRSCRCG